MRLPRALTHRQYSPKRHKTSSVMAPRVAIIINKNNYLNGRCVIFLTAIERFVGGGIGQIILLSRYVQQLDLGKQSDERHRLIKQWSKVCRPDLVFSIELANQQERIGAHNYMGGVKLQTPAKTIQKPLVLGHIVSGDTQIPAPTIDNLVS